MKFGLNKQQTEKVVTKIVTKTLGKKLEKASLKKQCRVLESLMGMAGVVETRARVLKGMEEDCAEMRHNSKTPEQIVEHFWSEPAFIRVWTKMGLNKTHLEVLARGKD